ncbi:zinc transporter ZIP13 homolog [Galendromus occidentalis]|uniref:Zinc transporter ZIP13 homolog n=1 Tax=Galendromus occidentalis TaxID=34638 RepID=A0AAJ6QP08_9ACAR|nr:zinc transporter ZIP13 homolog [Galendromus occidentalis]
MEAVHGDRGLWTWLWTLGATCAVGLSGILPLFVISPEMGLRLKADGDTGGSLRIFLGFAVGGLLGDVFLHLLPEAFEAIKNNGNHDNDSALRICGMWTLVGIFTFVLVEILVSAHQRMEERIQYSRVKKDQKENGTKEKNTDLIHISGYLNLVANAIDNFSHGLAVAGSFIAGPQVGLVTTFAILLHEIPHEIGDFAILLKSGFSRWQAAKAQLSTASIGMIGAITALSVERLETLGRCTTWILPFTAGGFLNIALIGVLPELLKEDQPKESVKQFLSVFLGIMMMAGVQYITH